MNDDCGDDTDHITYSPKSGVYSTAYEEEPPSVALIEAMMEITGKDMTELASLNESIGVDVDALDELFQSTNADDHEKDDRVEFVYENCKVLIFSFGRVEIEPLDEDD